MRTGNSILAPAVAAAALIAIGCGDETESAPPVPFNYLVWANVPAPDSDTNLVIPVEELPSSGELSFDNGIVFSTPIDVHAFNGSVYISDAGPQNLTKYDVVDDELQVYRRISFADRGGVNYFFFLDENRAFTVNRPQLELIEFNPTTMTITGAIDLGVVDRDDIDHEIRRGFLRASDNTLFLYIAYNTMRQVFDNTLVVAVIDLDTGTTSIERQEACPASAGFGGFFDDDGTLYLMGDSFGGFTLLLPDPSQVKPNCVVRIPPDSRTFDPDYLFRPATQLGGAEAWGLFEVNGGLL